MEVALSDNEVGPTPVLLTNGLQQGEYYIGPRIPSVSASPVKTIQEHLGKKVESDEFVTMKILSLMSPNGDSSDDNQGKVLIHNEHSILSLLQDQPGVIHQHGLFRESNRIILVLDCVHPHNYDSRGLYQDFVNLQQYVIQEKKIHEREALELFLMLMNIVQAIHKKNIVHRDLKLGNVVINKSYRSRQVTIINFALGKHLVREDDLLTDQRGSLAYVSPDVLSGDPYAGKPSDMWSLGILLYTMIYGQFPFYDNEPQELFRKIKTAKFSFPRDTHVSLETTLLMKQMIELDPSKRLTASSACDAIQSILSRLTFTIATEPVQIVPEVDTSNASDSLVPDQENGTQTTNAFVSELTAPRLTINPFLTSDQQYGRFLVQSPQSPTESGQFFFPTEPMHRIIPSINPFLCASPTGRYSSPTTSNFSSSQSLPASMYSTQRHNILQTSSSPDSVQEYSPSFDIHLHPYHVHHRHSFSEGDPNSSSHLRSLLTHPSPVSHTHGRRSLGSMLGTIQQNRPHRRNSHHSPSRGINPMLSEMPRIRRRSHEPRDNEREILQSLHAAVDRGSVQRPYSAEHTT